MTGSLHHTVNYTCLYITLKVPKISLQSLLSLNNVGRSLVFIISPKPMALGRLTKSLGNCIQGGQSRDTHVVISHVLFSFFARFKVCFPIIFLFFGGFQKCHLVQSTQTRKLFLMALKF